MHFWDAYGKKIGRKKCEAKWKRLSLKTKKAIMAHVPVYVAATPNVEFRKYPYSYLNSEIWEDDWLPNPNFSRPGSAPAAADARSAFDPTAQYPESRLPAIISQQGLARADFASCGFMPNSDERVYMLTREALSRIGGAA